MDFESVVSGKRSSPAGGCRGSADPAAETGHGSPNSKRQRSGLVEDDAWRMLEVGGADLSSSRKGENFAAFVGSNLWALAVDDGHKMPSCTSEFPSTGGNIGCGSGRNIGFSVAQNELDERTGGVKWGPFLVGYPSSNDPKPGKCRRTDGKQWRCSKEAVPDQKTARST